MIGNTMKRIIFVMELKVRERKNDIFYDKCT